MLQKKQKKGCSLFVNLNKCLIDVIVLNFSKVLVWKKKSKLFALLKISKTNELIVRL
jgi:hypothetical protein